MNREYLKREKEMWTNQYQDELPPLELVETFTWSRIILQVANDIKAKTTLETGSGSGKFSFMLANKGYEATAMDFNESILKSLKKNNLKVKKSIKIVEGNLLNIPFPDNSFDLVFSEGTNEHFLGADREKAMREMVRVSKDKIIIFVPDAQSKEYLERNDPLEGEYPFTKAELSDMCELCGMQISGTGSINDQIFVVGTKIKKYSDAEEWLTCEECGKKSVDVKKRIDPYDQDIHDEENWVTICDECDKVSADEI